MLKRLAFFFALFLPAGAFAQVQYEIVSVPVCWNDSSLVKYAYVTTSGAYLDLGYFSPSGTPVTVSGGTLKTGFCFDQTFSIDSTANRTFTITLGGQAVGFEDQVGAEYYAQLLDVDTAGVDTNYIAKYSPSAAGWKMYDNRINGLTDGYKDTNNNIFLFNPPFNEITGSDNAGILSLYRLKTGFENTGFGNYSGLVYTTGSQNDLFGFFASPQDTSGNRSTFLGSYTNMHPYLPIQAGTGKVKADESIFIGHRSRGLSDTSKYEITIGAFSIGKGDSTVTLGLPFYKGTYLNGNLNLNGYGAGNKEAADLTKTRSAYIAAFATDGTLLELDTTGLYASGATALNDLTDVVLTSPQINDVLKYNGTNWVNDTLTVSGGGGVLSVTANNGLNNTGTASQPVIELGGTLTRATTTISANFKSLEINRPLNFMVDSVFLAKIQTQDGLSTSSYFSLGAASNSWRSVNNDDGLTNQVRLYSSSPTQGAEISSYQNANNGVFTQIELLPQEMQIVTPNVNTLTATAGQVLKLVNASTGEVEFASDSTGATTLNDLTDVVLTSPQINDVLKYDGANWVNDTLTVSGGGGFTLPTDSITFNDNNADAVEGKLQYDTDYGTLVFGAQNNTPIHIGLDMGWYVKNQTGSPIAKGVPVYASGTDGASGRITIAPMIADNSIEAKFFLGVTAEAIANGADGFVWTHGKIRPLSLTGFSAGDVLYVSPTSAGTFTATEPTAPNLKLPVGFVVNNTSNGTLAVRSTIGNYLADAHDVQLTSPSNGQALKYDGTKWVNGTDLVNDADADPTNELQDLSLSGTTLSLTNDATTVDLSGFLTSEVDGSVTNEGSLSVTAGTGTTSVINSNTSGSAAVTLEASTGISISETGNTISITNSLPEATTASNGLTETGNDIALGGTLTKNTTITMAGNDMTFTGTTGSDVLIDLAGSTTINSTNVSGYNSSLILDGVSPRLLADAKTTEPLNMIELMGGRAGVKEMTLSSQVSNDNTTYTAMYFNPLRVSLKTPNVVDLTAQNGQFLQLVDRLTGEIEFASALSTEVDGSVTNEGALSIGTGVAGSSVFIQSNTSASTPVTISVGAGFDIAASGSTIFLNPEPFAIETGTSGAISWGSLPQRIHVLDFGANTSITLSFTNVAIGGIYTLRVTGNSGTDTLVWPGAAKFEDGTSAGTVTLQDGGQMFTFYWDGTNYWVK